MSASNIQLERAERPEDGDWRQARPAIAVRVRDGATARLIDTALDAGHSPLSSTTADERLLEAFGQRLMEDLFAALEDSLQLESWSDNTAEQNAAAFTGYCLQVVLTDSLGTDMMGLAIPFEALIPVCVTCLGPRHSLPVQLDSLTGALGPTSVNIRARLGSVSMPMADLSGLAPGDILVLDKALEDGVDICVAEAARPFAQAEITQANGQVALVLRA